MATPLSRHRRWLMVGALTVGALSFAANAFAATTPWTVVNPASGSDPNTNAVLNGAVLRTPTDGWAVGTQFGSAGAGSVPGIAYHWNGTTWSRSTTPTVPDTSDVALFSVAASGATDAWAGGLSHTRFGGYHGGNTLLEHWDGTAWSVAASPNIGGINAVADLGTTNAYAFADTGLVEHWDGGAWASVDIPHPNPADTVSDDFAAVSADAPNDIWAVGSYVGATGIFALHYDGATWTDTALPIPSVGGALIGMSDVAAISPTNVWAVGSANGGGFIEHFDGTAWTETPLPAGLYYSHLNTIAARSATDIRVMGYAYADANGTQLITASLHWNGTAWSKESSGLSASGYHVNRLVAPSGASPYWAVGYNSTNQPQFFSHS